jgi:hypothetical protein
MAGEATMDAGTEMFSVKPRHVRFREAEHASDPRTLQPNTAVTSVPILQ